MIGPNALLPLKDLHLPQSISMAPIAAGWWILYIGLFFSIGYGWFRWRAHQQSQLPLKHALHQLERLEDLLQANPRQENIAALTSTLLRRTALHYYDRKKIAGLSGNAWLNFLNTTGNTDAFTGHLGELLLAAPYQKNNPSSSAPLIKLTRHWLITVSKQASIKEEP